jgi:hypothetical protein
VLLLLGSCGRPDVTAANVPLALDREERLADQPLSGSTQSVNRYQSVLSRFGAVDVKLHRDRLRVTFRDQSGVSPAVAFENIDPRFVLPLLPYPHEK